MDIWSLGFYALALLPILVFYLLRRRRIGASHRLIQQEAIASGLTEPASLHPIIDSSRCLGCGACVTACPEQPHHTVLGLIDGKAVLISPTDCIGHGLCKTVCPFDAITLVFGTEHRGVDIPVLGPNFESNIPGVFIAGELGGMGLIRNALTQGHQAMEAIAAAGSKRPGALDVLIVGAGPAGLSAALSAKQLGLSYLVVEQESLGGAVFQYPRGKLVMTAPVELPLVGKVHFRDTSKEALLDFWTEVSSKHGLSIRCRERVVSIERHHDQFVVMTEQHQQYRAAAILLAIGRRGTPRKLNVPGEELPKVVYRLIDPEQYRNREVIVVGGGDSALEAAATIAELGDTRVVLSYRGDAFQRAKTRNRERVQAAAGNGRLDVLLGSQIREIRPHEVILHQEDRDLRLSNQDVIVNAGGILPNDFLRTIGIDVETKYGTA